MRDLSQNPLKIGILGCGSFITRRILPLLKEMKTIRVVCIHNRNQAKAAAIAKQFNIPLAVSNRETLLVHPEVEAVHIASPNFLHEEDALACAVAGLPTLCEKPLSTSLDSVIRMVDAFKDRSIPFFVGHQMRFKPAVQKAKELLLAKEFGTLLHLRAYYYSRPIPENDWRFGKGNGGDVIQEIGIHLVDLIHFISGEQITEVHACKTDQMASLQGKLPSGALVSFECAYARSYYSGFEVIGTKSRLISCNSLRQTDDPGESLCIIEEDKTIEYPLQRVNVYLEEYNHFAKAVVQGLPSTIEANISLANQSVIDQAHQQHSSLDRNDAMQGLAESNLARS